MSLSDVVKVVEEKEPARVNKYLATGRWILLSVGFISHEDGSGFHLYSLGWLGATVEIGGTPCDEYAWTESID